MTCVGASNPVLNCKSSSPPDFMTCRQLYTMQCLSNYNERSRGVGASISSQCLSEVIMNTPDVFLQSVSAEQSIESMSSV